MLFNADWRIFSEGSKIFLVELLFASAGHICRATIVTDGIQYALSF